MDGMKQDDRLQADEASAPSRHPVPPVHPVLLCAVTLIRPCLCRVRSIVV